MKKITLLSPFVLLLAITPILAANQKASPKQVENSTVQSVDPADVVVETAETEVDFEVTQTTEVTEASDDDSGQVKNSRSQNAYQHMSIVAQSVEALLKTKVEGGIGEQVREIAHQQIQVQEQIKQNLHMVESRPGWFKKLFGVDKKTIRNLNDQIEQNQLQLEQLTEVQTQLNNQSDQQTVQLAVETLTSQTTALQQVLEEEEQIKGIFSWLTALFAR